MLIYHNPRCSKSRKTLEIIESRGIAPEIVRYLDTPPDAARIQELAGLLDVAVADLVRRGESEFRDADDLPELDDDAALAAWLAQHPKCIERPIVVDDTGNRAVIGRPPENVLEILES